MGTCQAINTPDIQYITIRDSLQLLQNQNNNNNNQVIPVNQNTAHFNSDNTRSYTNTVHSNSDNDNKLTKTNQGQTNTPIIFCVIAKGSCPSSNIQGQGSGN